MEPGRPKGSYRAKRLSPKAKLALKAVVLGGMKHREAAQVAGLHKVYVSQLKNSTPGQEYMAELEGKLDEKSLDTSALLTQLGREAIERLAGLMRFSANENIILRASQDLADRAPDTQKIQRHQVESFTLSGRDAKEIAEAMVASAKMKEQFQSAAQGDYIRIPMETPSNDGVEG